MSRFLKQNTAVRVTVGPFLDKTDGITPEVALTATNEKLTFMVDTGDVPTLVIDANATASGGNNDLVHVTNDDAGFYDLELTAAQTNYVGRALLAITYATDHCPVFHEFTILPANVYDALLGTDLLQVDSTQQGGTTLTARDIGASVLLSVGTGTGQVNLSSGKTPATIAAGDIASGAITATVIAADAIGASELAADAVAEIADAIWDEATSGHTGAGTSGKALTDANNGTPPAASAVADAVWDEARSGHTGAGSFGEGVTSVQGSVTGSVASVTGAVGSVTGAVGSVTAEVSANVTKISGDGTAADNAESFFDGTGYAGTNNVIPTVTTVTTATNLTNAPSSGDLTAAMKASINAEVVDVLRTDTIPDSVAADGAQPTIAQALYAILQFLTEKSVSSTTLTVKKPDGSTSLMTFTLNDATAPSSITRAS